MGAITTHILDTSQGRPASGVPVVLEVRSAAHEWKVLGKGRTDADGRLANLLPPGSHLEEGTYRLTFEVSAYYRSHNVESLYPEVCVVFKVSGAARDYHIPLLLSPYGYATYRGS
jgi:5-hydroxyisourate hydrolase